MAACSSTENKSTEEKAMQYYLYPPPIARYEDVIANPKLFMDTLGNFHAAMGTKFMIPIVGGKDLDLHRLFVEVTSRGGIKRVLEEKKWKEVTNAFSFPPSATNASFIIRKYYMSLIHHFEQVYYFKAKAWTPVSTDTWQSTKSALTSTSKVVLPLAEFQMDPTKPRRSPSAEAQATPMKRQRTEDSLPEDSAEASIGFPVTGVIDGKFDSGYLCTVMIGGEPLQGVLYQCTGHLSYQIPKHLGVVTPCQTTIGNATRSSTIVRRRRRKKSEMKKRDPAHPKPNRSGYNFFFAEQHARLKPLHPGKDRDISRMIGELWNNLTESNKVVYQEKAMKDKERYRMEMERYRESLRTEREVTNAVPLLQQLFKQDLNAIEFNEPLEPDDGRHESKLASACSEAKTVDKDAGFGLPLVGGEVMSMETEAPVGGEELPRDVEMVHNDGLFLVNESNQPKPVTESGSFHEHEPKHDEETRRDEPTIADTEDVSAKIRVEVDGTVKPVEEPEQLMSQIGVEYEPLNEQESVANLEQEADGLCEHITKVRNDGVEDEGAFTNEVESLPQEGGELTAIN